MVRMGSISVDPQPAVEIELVREQLIAADLNDLCDATDAAIQNGGGFGWVEKPSRDILERYWQGVITMPSRLLFVARLDQVICGTAQLVLPPKNNEAQSFSAQLTSHFVSPWARGHGIAGRMLSVIEDQAKKEKVEVINLDIRETQEAAIRLYEGAGYVQLGRHPYYAKVDDEVIPGRYYYKLLA